MLRWRLKNFKVYNRQDLEIGLADGTRCNVCPKSEGVIRGTCDVCDGKCKVLAPSFKIKLSRELISTNFLEVQEVEENLLLVSINDEKILYITIDEFLDVAEKVKKMREEE